MQRVILKLNAGGEAKLTKRQNQIFEFIRARVEEHNMPPTRSEIGAKFDISNQSASAYIILLQGKGLLEFSKNHPRSIRLLHKKNA